jgi:hypothetical protein
MVIVNLWRISSRHRLNMIALCSHNRTGGYHQPVTAASKSPHRTTTTSQATRHRTSTMPASKQQAPHGRDEHVAFVEIVVVGVSRAKVVVHLLPSAHVGAR